MPEVKKGDQFIVVKSGSHYPTADKIRYDMRNPHNRLRKGEILTVHSFNKKGQALYEFGRPGQIATIDIPMDEVEPYTPEVLLPPAQPFKVGNWAKMETCPSGTYAPRGLRALLYRKSKPGDVVRITKVVPDGDHSYVHYASWTNPDQWCFTRRLSPSGPPTATNNAAALSLPILFLTGVISMRQIAEDPSVQKAVVVLVYMCVTFAGSQMAWFTTTRVAKGLAAVGDRRRRIRREEEEYRLAAVVKSLKETKSL